MSSGKVFGMKRADGAQMIVQEDCFDDKTMCQQCGKAEMFGYACVHCKKIHCQACLPFEVHSCDSWREHEARSDAQRRQHAGATTRKFSTCSHPDCAEKLLTDMRCYYCNVVYCSAHRMESDHSCDKAEAQKRRDAQRWSDEQAKKIAGKRRPSAPARAASQPVSLPDDLHVDDRFLVNVVLPPAHLLPVPEEAAAVSNPLPALVHRRWGSGKVADSLSQHLGQQPGPGRTKFILVEPATLSPVPMFTSFDALRNAGKASQGARYVLLPQELYNKLREAGAEGLPRSCSAEAVAQAPADWASFATLLSAQA
eukprot:TRINITY_DN671_c0_g1_i1.p1 TRINITY_DN671_c0_g1~~TRINITY_DN671_c0_g1_i1.p1  ORF type:complete len:311 (+),score=116.52 TRINITY_DN671_c0_g1_i1:1300-2232(+)